MTIQSMASNAMSPAMTRLASGNRINSAADDAAGLAVVENMTSQIRGLDQGTRNTMDMQSLISTAEGGLDGINDSLGRIRELSVQASNGTLSAANREMIQAEISQLAEGIGATVNGTQFNGMNLLDGSGAGGLNTASGADGTGATVVINDMSSLAQAITTFNVTGEFNINDIDAMIAEVTGERANLGAMENRMDFTMNANMTSSINMSESRSRVGDADMAQEMMNLNQERAIAEVQMLMQQQAQAQREQESQIIAGITGA
ncbi:MAG: flagellin FliC5 [Defluviitaleaceae bacterium]|nr:flagellin FliC5 [Defluviitaleaceae bacterium]